MKQSVTNADNLISEMFASNAYYIAPTSRLYEINDFTFIDSHVLQSKYIIYVLFHCTYTAQKSQ